MNLDNIKAILFDYNDTLVESKNIKFRALQYMAKEVYSFILSTEELQEHWGKPMDQLAQSLFGEYDSLENIYEHYNKIREDFPSRPYKNLRETIKVLSSHFILGIVTASSRKYILKDFTNFRLDISKFAYLQAAEESNFHKPDPKVFIIKRKSPVKPVGFVLMSSIKSSIV